MVVADIIQIVNMINSAAEGVGRLVGTLQKDGTLSESEVEAIRQRAGDATDRFERNLQDAKGKTGS